MAGRRSSHSELTDELQELLDERDLLALLDTAAGRRMGLAKSRAGLEAKGICISEAGHAALIGHFGSGSTIQLPLMREWRAVRYASDGTSNGEIATKLGLTESAVDKLFARLGGKPPRRPN